MILDSAAELPHAATLDDLFRRAGVRHPQATALIDPSDREQFTDGAPRTLSYAVTDELISAFAGRLRALGLHTDSVVAIQLPNTVDGVIALLGTLRAGMIAAMLPLLWRQREIVAALRDVGCKAIITCARAGRHSPAKAAVLAAAELFPIRHICGFGRDLPDGVVPFDDLGTQSSAESMHAQPRPGVAAAHVAALTFDVTAQGVVAVPRSHVQLIAGGLSPYREAAIAEDSLLLTTIPPVTFAGLALGVVPWLLSGGTLALYAGREPKNLAARCAAMSEATIVLPGPAVGPLGENGGLDRAAAVVGLWRAPERLEACAPWQGKSKLVDVAAFGEIGLLAAGRRVDGMPAMIPHGLVSSPGGATGSTTSLSETARGKSGTLKLRGPAVATHSFPPHTKPAESHAPDAAGFVDTGFFCRDDRTGLTVTAPPAGIATIGGYRLSRPALEAEVAAVDPKATILPIPDALLSERLAGAAADPPGLVAALRTRGANPLISGAFRLRGEADAA